MLIKTMRWAGFFIVVAVLAAVVQPVGVQAQFFLGLVGVIIMAAIRHLPVPAISRQIFLAIGVTIVLRYMYWRATATLPSPDDLMSFIPGILLFCAEIYSVGMLMVNLIVIADPIERKAVKLKGDPKYWPTVDIFVPSYNEDADIVGTTLAAAANLDYPEDKLNVYLCDDGGTDQKCNDENPAKARQARERRRDMQKLCQDMGVHYVTRARNEHAKAGNMNSAMKHSNGDLIVVFDADHAPVRTFLQKTVGYYQRDPKLFLVQTPHFFMNPDPVEKNLSTFRIMPSENEMFYSIIQRGLDKWDGTFFCGSGAVLSRKALEEVGGFSGISITEDCETAIDLHSRGWSSIYVDEPMIAGFQPETFEAFIGQRSRWCQGMLQIFILKNPLLNRTLKLPQKLAYTSSMFFWLFPLSRLSFMIAPAMFVFFNLEIYNATIQEFVAYTVFLMLATTQMQNYMYGKVRWPWISELYEYLQSLHLARSIVSVLLNPRKPSFDVTAKGLTLENNHFSPAGWPFFIMFLFLLATTLTAIYRLFSESASDELLIVVLVWSLFNLAIGGISLGAVAERRERRRHYRMGVTMNALTAAMEVNGEVRPVEISDASIGGMAIKEKCDHPVQPFNAPLAKIHLNAPGHNKPLHSFNVALKWARGSDGQNTYGTALEAVTARDRRTLAMLMYPNSAALLKIRKDRRGNMRLTAGSFLFVRWFIYQTFRGIKTALAQLMSGQLSGEAKQAPKAQPEQEVVGRPVGQPAE